MLSMKKALTLALLLVCAAPCHAMLVATKSLFTSAATLTRQALFNRPVIYGTSGYGLGKTAEYFMQNPDTRTPITQLQNPFSFAAIRQRLFNAKVNAPTALAEVRQNDQFNKAFTTTQTYATNYWNMARQNVNSLFNTTSTKNNVDDAVTSEEVSNEQK
ncbi:MAG: hypothetical protein WD055_00790 [Candidatus Dependentiae bacterium]